MACIKVMMAWEFRCTDCAGTERSTNKHSLVMQSAHHAMFTHHHPPDDDCQCPLVKAVNDPTQVIWAFLVPIDFAFRDAQRSSAEFSEV